MGKWWEWCARRKAHNNLSTRCKRRGRHKSLCHCLVHACMCVPPVCLCVCVRPLVCDCQAGSLEREVQAVDSEFKGVQQSDHSRLAQLMCHTVSVQNQAHRRVLGTPAHRHTYAASTLPAPWSRHAAPARCLTKAPATACVPPSDSLCGLLGDPVKEEGWRRGVSSLGQRKQHAGITLRPPPHAFAVMCCAVLCCARTLVPLSVAAVTCTTSSAGATCAACGSSRVRGAWMCGNTSSTSTGDGTQEDIQAHTALDFVPCCVAA